VAFADVVVVVTDRVPLRTAVAAVVVAAYPDCHRTTPEATSFKAAGRAYYTGMLVVIAHEVVLRSDHGD
jgi:hypothetical protein